MKLKKTLMRLLQKINQFHNILYVAVKDSLLLFSILIIIFVFAQHNVNLPKYFEYVWLWFGIIIIGNLWKKIGAKTILLITNSKK